VSSLLSAVMYSDRPSGAGTNLKTGLAQSGVNAKKRFFLSCPSTLFFGSTITISRFCERFCDGQYSLVSFVFAVILLTVPHVPSHL